MLRAKLVLALMALLAPAALAPTVAQTSPNGLGILPILEETLPGNLDNFNERLENLFGLSSHPDAGIDAAAIGNANNTEAINRFASNMPAINRPAPSQESGTQAYRVAIAYLRSISVTAATTSTCARPCSKALTQATS